MRPPKRSLVIGIGNSLRRDDGVGGWIARQLAAVDPTAALTVTQLTPELTAVLVGVGRLYLIDAAAQPADPPGTIRAQRVRPVGDALFRLTHHLTPDSLLTAARAWYGAAPTAVLITISAADFGIGDGLTPPVQAAADRVLARLLVSVCG